MENKILRSVRKEAFIRILLQSVQILLQSFQKALIQPIKNMFRKNYNEYPKAQHFMLRTKQKKWLSTIKKLKQDNNKS